MNSFELNKLIGAFLGAVFIIFSVSLLSESIFYSPAPATPGYAIAVPENEGTGGAEPEAAPESVLPLLASADPSAGESVFRRCQACHTVEQGGPNKVGPNLWDIVDAPLAHLDNFSYSAALQEASQDRQVTWTYDNLDHFLTNPRGFIPGTAMSFAGLANVQDRANVIAYLRTLSDEPAPLPEAAPAEGGDSEAAPAEGDEAAPAEGDEATPAEGEEAAPGEGDAQQEPADAGQEAAPDAEGAQTPAEDAEAAPTEDTPAAPEAGETETGNGDQEPVPAQ